MRYNCKQIPNGNVLLEHIYAFLWNFPYNCAENTLRRRGLLGGAPKNRYIQREEDSKERQNCTGIQKTGIRKTVIAQHCSI